MVSSVIVFPRFAYKGKELFTWCVVFNVRMFQMNELSMPQLRADLFHML